MRGDDDRLATLIEIEEEREDIVGIARVEIARRLVADDRVRVMDERTRDSDPLRLATRQRMDEAVDLREESDLREYLGDTLEDVPIWIPADLHREGDVFADGLAREELVVLEDDADIAPILRHTTTVEGRNVDTAVVENLSRLRPESADERIDEARLTAAGVADEEDKLARSDVESDVAEDGAVAVGDSEALDAHGV